MNSTFKKPRLDNGNEIDDLTSSMSKVLKIIGKFKLFSGSVDSYLTKFEHSKFIPFEKLDSTVDLFYKLLEKDMHNWFFSNLHEELFVS